MLNEMIALYENSLSDRVDDLLKLQFQREKHTILLVDDEENNLQLLKRTFRNSYNILSAKNGVEALEVVEEHGDEISLIVSDQRMPEMIGTEFLKRTDEKYPNIIKILLTGNTDVDIIISAINECHLYEYVLKPFEPQELQNTIKNGIAKFELTSGKSYILGELKELFYKTIKSISSALDAKDPYTSGHAMRVTLYSLMLARKLNVPDDIFEDIEISGLLHDIGKIGIPEKILCKQGKLTDEEYGIMCTHPEQGKKMVKEMKQFEIISDGLGAHHEKWNGTGYPNKLKGEEIPFIARIIALADTYDAMTSTRSYRAALPHETAIAEIERCSGTQFDPEYAKSFIEISEEIRKAKDNPEEYYRKYSTIQQYFDNNADSERNDILTNLGSQIILNKDGQALLSQVTGQNK